MNTRFKSLHIFHATDLSNGVDRTTLTLITALRRLNHQPHALVPKAGPVSEALEAAGIPYRTAFLGCCTGPTKPAELAYLSRAADRAGIIGEWLDTEGFDFVHLNTGHLIDGAIAATISGTPAIWHIHSPFEIDLSRYARFFKAETYAWMLETLGDHVIAVSDDVRASLTERLPGEFVSALYNGIDIEHLDANSQPVGPGIRHELGLKEETALVLGVGRISEQKDFATFVRVAKRVTNENADVCFAIVGPSEDRGLAKALEDQLEKLGLRQRVFLLGSRNDVPALLAQCNAFLSTAIYEGQGLAALEAMALRRPVIAMDCVGLRECVDNGHDGLLVPLGNEDEAAQAVLRVLRERDWAHGLGIQGRQSVMERFSAQAYAQGFLDIAAQVARRTPPDNKRASADFALGLLSNIREANERAKHLAARPGYRDRLKSKLAQWGIGKQ